MKTPRISMRKSLPLLICGLLVLVIASYSWAAYRAVRRTLIDAANARLSGVADQIASSLENGARQSRPLLHRLSEKPELRTYLRDPSRRNEAAAREALRDVGPTPQQVTSVELWDREHKQRLLSVMLKGPGSGNLLELDEWPEDSASVGRLHSVRDSLVYPVVVPVMNEGRRLGYLVQWRGISGSPQTQAQYSRLIGANAGLYVGNDRGDIWTDLAGQIDPPPIRGDAPEGLAHYERPELGERMAYKRALRGIPWVVLLEFSSDAVLSTASDFVRHVAGLSAFILALGLILGLFLSRGISGPIEQLTTATEQVATGGADTPVSASRHAELGRLADSFNTMVQRVRDSQHRLEERVAERTKELQERNEDLEAFGYSISHDLRAPLRAMQGFSQILLDEYGDRMDAEGRRYAGKIVAGATRMDSLIRDLLAYSRISRAQMEPARVNLSRIVKEALEQLDAELREKNASVKVEDPLPAVVGHAATLSQVIANLVGNGLKFVPPGRLPEVHVRAETANDVTRLWVEDNGIGIRPEHQERIFRVFERLHATEEYPGTGIGLAIVRKGIERMGGRVGVESSFGQGSRFWIELPNVTVRPAA